MLFLHGTKHMYRQENTLFARCGFHYSELNKKQKKKNARLHLALFPLLDTNNMYLPHVHIGTL